MQNQIIICSMVITICFLLVTSCIKEEMNIKPSIPTLDRGLTESTIELHSVELEICNIMQIEIQRDSVKRVEMSEKYDMGNGEVEYFSAVKSSPYLKLIGNGGGVTEDYGRCLTTFQLNYNLLSNQATGEVICEFYPSESKIQFKLKGNSPVQTISRFDGPHEALVLEMELMSASGIFATSSFEMTAFLLDVSELYNPELDDLNTYMMITGNMN